MISLLELSLISKIWPCCNCLKTMMIVENYLSREIECQFEMLVPFEV